MQPIFLTTAICFSSLLFENNALADRINTSATMFLTTMALLFVVSTDLPKTTFLSKLVFVLCLHSLFCTVGSCFFLSHFCFSFIVTSAKIDVYLNGSMMVQLAVLFESCVVSGALSSGGILPSDAVDDTATYDAIDDWTLRLGAVGYLLFTAAYFIPRYMEYKRIAANTDASPLKLKSFDKSKGELPFYKFEEGTNVFF